MPPPKICTVFAHHYRNCQWGHTADQWKTTQEISAETHLPSVKLKVARTRSPVHSLLEFSFSHHYNCFFFYLLLGSRLRRSFSVVQLFMKKTSSYLRYKFSQVFDWNKKKKRKPKKENNNNNNNNNNKLSNQGEKKKRNRLRAKCSDQQPRDKNLRTKY